MISQELRRPYTMDGGAAAPVMLTVDASRLEADLTAVDWLARLALIARRNGGQIELHGATRELRGLIELAGLDDVLLSRASLGD
jgi:ABC-type transporter Mla MlaB component